MKVGVLDPLDTNVHLPCVFSQLLLVRCALVPQQVCKLAAGSIHAEAFGVERATLGHFVSGGHVLLFLDLGLAVGESALGPVLALGGRQPIFANFCLFLQSERWKQVPAGTLVRAVEKLELTRRLGCRGFTCRRRRGWHKWLHVNAKHRFLAVAQGRIIER